MEIGASAISFLVATWDGHLTPPEAASTADKASKSRDNTMVSLPTFVTVSWFCVSLKPYSLINYFTYLFADYCRC